MHSKRFLKELPTMEQSQKLSSHLLLFFRYLRDAGFLIGPKEMNDGLRALESIDITDLGKFRLVLKIVLCSSKEEQDKFDQEFNRFFINNLGERDRDMLHFLSKEKKVDDLLENNLSNHEKESKENEQQKINDGKNEADHTIESEEEVSTGSIVNGLGQGNIVNDNIEEERSQAASWTAAKIMSKEPQKIKAYVSSDQFQTMEKAARTFVNQINLKRSRRYKVSKKGLKLDFRRTLRQSVQMGGYPIKPVWVGPDKHKADFILLCDSSRSMSSFSEPFLQFAFAMTKCKSDVEIFLFSTKLRKVTEQFTTSKQGEFPVLTVFEDEWGGGTSIGESLYSFVSRYGTYLLKKNTVILIASDGLDAGEIDNLQWAMKEIYRRTSAVIWLNPLLNIDGYEPTARGMKTALPYIDLFSNATNASSFLKLANTVNIRR